MVDGGGLGLRLGTGGVAGDELQRRHSSAAELHKVELPSSSSGGSYVRESGAVVVWC